MPATRRTVLKNRARPAATPWLWSASVKRVTSAVDSAPSPRKRRNRLGKRQAVMKASKMPALSPNSAAEITSRTKPSKRLTSVSPETNSVRENSRWWRPVTSGSLWISGSVTAS